MIIVSSKQKRESKKIRRKNHKRLKVYYLFYIFYIEHTLCVLCVNENIGFVSERVIEEVSCHIILFLIRSSDCAFLYMIRFTNEKRIHKYDNIFDNIWMHDEKWIQYFITCLKIISKLRKLKNHQINNKKFDIPIDSAFIWFGRSFHLY